MKKIISFILVLMLVISGCSSSDSDEKVEITFAFWDESINSAYEKVAEKYEEDNPNVDIVFETVSWDEYWSGLFNRAQTDDLPDIITMHPSYYNSFGDEGVLVSMDDYFTDYTSKYDYGKEDIPEAPQYTTDGVQYAIPRDTAYSALVFNEDIFDEAGVEYPQPGWTYEDFTNTLEELNNNLGENVEPYFNHYDMQMTTYGYTLKAGGELPTEAGTFDDENVKDAYKEWWSITNEAGYSSQPKEYSDIAVSFVNGEMAMTTIGTWELGNINENEEFIEHVGIVNMPYYNDDENMSIYNNNASAVTTSSENPEIAKDFIAYLGSEEASYEIMNYAEVISARKLDYTDQLLEKYPYFENYPEVHEMSTIDGTPSPSSEAGVFDVITEYNSKIINTDNWEEASEFYDKMNEEVNSKF